MGVPKVMYTKDGQVMSAAVMSLKQANKFGFSNCCPVLSMA